MNEFFLKKINDINVVSSSKIYIKNIEMSLRILKEWDKNNFNKVNKYLKTILIHPKNKDYNLLIANKNAWITGYQNVLDNDYDASYMASLFIHETYHITQYFSGHKNYGKKAETEAYKIQRKFLKKIKYDYAVDWLDKQYKKKWWKSLGSDKKNADDFRHLLNNYQNGKLDIQELKSIKF